MMIATPIALLVLLVPLSLLAATVFLWARVVRGFTVANADSPTCGKCGAGVRGIGSLTCPECGADLREVGIVTPKGRATVSVLPFVLGWTLLPVLPALVGLGILTAVGPTVSTTSLSFTLNDAPHVLNVDARYRGPQPGGGMSSSSSSSMVNGVRTAMTSIGLPTTASSSIQRLELRLTTPAGPTALTFRPDTGVYEVAHSGQSVDEPVPLDPTALRGGLLLAANTTAPLTDEKLQGLTDLANALATGSSSVVMQGWGGGMTSSWGRSSRPAWWYLALVLAGFVAIYIAGFVIYFRLRDRATRRLEPEGPLTP